jgi:hypothetical protein
MAGGNICDLDYEEVFDGDEKEFSTFFARNINQIIVLMKKDKNVAKDW